MGLKSRVGFNSAHRDNWSFKIRGCKRWCPKDLWVRVLAVQCTCTYACPVVHFYDKVCLFCAIYVYLITNFVQNNYQFSFVFIQRTHLTYWKRSKLLRSYWSRNSFESWTRLMFRIYRSSRKFVSNNWWKVENWWKKEIFRS